MTRWASTTTCDQAGQLISLRLDGELPELQRAALERHLDRCPGCRALAAELAGLAGMLREAPLVELERELVTTAPRPPDHGRVVGRVLAGLALAGAAAAAAVVAFAPSTSKPQYSAAPTFRSTAEQIRFVRTEQQRIERTVPAVLSEVRPQVTARSL